MTDSAVMQNATIDAPAASRTATPSQHAPATGPSATSPAHAARTARTSEAGQKTTRLMLGLAVVGVLSTVALLSRPQQSVAANQGPGSAARLASRPAVNPAFALDAPSTGLFDGALLAGHTGIPVPPASDAQGRANLGVLVGPSLFVWVYGGTDGVRYTVADLTGQVLSAGLTADEVYGAFPEVNIPEMQFGPDGRLCEPIMWAGEPDGLE